MADTDKKFLDDDGVSQFAEETKKYVDNKVSQLDDVYIRNDDTTVVRLRNQNEINLQEDHNNAWFGYRDGKVTNWKFGDGTEGGLADVYANDYYLGDEKLSETYIRVDDTTIVKLVNDNEINLQEDHNNAWFGYRGGKVTNWKFGDGTEGGLADVYVKDLYLGDQKLSDLLGDKANDADVVHKSGAETIGGVKSFSNNTYFTSLNSTNEVESQSSSGTAILPLVATMTYADKSKPQTARLNLRVAADGIKSLYPHENSAYSLGLSSRSWSDLYAYHGYFRGQQQNDEYSVNARTNLTLLANRDTLGTSGVVFDTFRENTAQGKGAHILGFGMKENSIRYEGCRFQWTYDSINLGYNFYLKPNAQGTNTPLTYNLGTSADKWTDVNTNAINGLNPGALSFPGTSYVNIDTTEWVLDGSTVNQISTLNSYAYLSLMTDCDDDGFIEISMGDYPNGHVYINSKSVHGYCGVFIPFFNINSYMRFFIRANSIRYARWYPLQGNV